MAIQEGTRRVLEVPAREALGNVKVAVKLTGLEQAKRMLKLGVLFIRFGFWLAGLEYEEV